jgi:hypothetical protein
LTDVTNKAQEAKLKLAIDMYLEHREASSPCMQTSETKLIEGHPG